MNKNTILITGASRGIGRALALQAAYAGADVIITCRTRERELAEVLQELEEYGVNTYAWVGDLSNSALVKELKEELELAVKAGRLCSMPNIIINNAGVSFVGLVQDTDDEIWNNIIGTNLSGPFYVAREFVPYMISNQKGLIINISSMWGKCGASCEVAYSASKAGLEGLTKSLAAELEPSNVDVISYRLGMIDTDMNRHFTNEDLDEIKEEIVNGQIGKPQEVAKYIITDIMDKNYKTGEIKEVPYGWFKEI